MVSVAAPSGSTSSTLNQPRSSPLKCPSTLRPFRSKCSRSAAGSGAVVLRLKTRNHIRKLHLYSLRRRTLLVLLHLGLADRLQQLLDDVLAGLALGLGLEVSANAMAQHRDGGFLDVVDGDAEAAVHRGERLAALH